MMNRSESIGAISGALAKAQAEMRGAVKDATNPHFKSSYADLASVWEACRTALTKHGIAVTQLPAADGAKVTVVTMLLHASGEWIASELTVTAMDAKPQSVGSALTYARRYSLAAMAGVAPEDDDGEAAQGRETSRPQQTYQAAPRAAGASTLEKQLTVSDMLYAAKSKADMEIVWKRADAELDPVTFSRFERDYHAKLEQLREAAKLKLAPKPAQGTIGSAAAADDGR